MSRIAEVGAGELATALRAKGRVLVEFWAPWCTQCAPMGQVVERLADQLPDDVAVLKLNVEQNEDAAVEHGVVGLPALILFKDGLAATRIVGFRRLPLVLGDLRSHL